MKVLLVNPSSPRNVPRSVRAELRYDPPLAALYLGSFLAKKGISTEIVDTAIDDISFEKIRDGEYGLVSFTVFIGEFQKKARELAEKMKEINPDIPIVFGGVMVSIFPEVFLQEYPVDYVIRYEGENTLYELVLALEGKMDLSGIKGLSYKKGKEIYHNQPRYLENDLDSFPVPMWALLGSYCNVRQIPYYYSIMTSKGCPFKCSFCYNRQVEDTILADSPTWRFRSAEHVIDEIKSIHDLTGTRVFTFGDDNFLVNRERAISILDYFKSNNLYIEQCIGHMNNFNSSELIGSMGGVVQTGIYALESASPRLLKLLQKNLKIELVPRINKGLFDKGISTIHNFIVGLPTETEADLRMNVDLMKELKEINPYVRGNPYLYLPLPNTPLESYISKTMGFSLPHSLIHYENARFDFEGGQKYRPWIDDDRYSLLKDYCDIFRDVFQINNLTIAENTFSLIDENPHLKTIFGDITRISKPPVRYVPYVLDRVLRGEEIDLEHDLARMSGR
jgi:anaerobic magnesium-protoporphyrin IX monomethyl ester cyclase